MAGCFQLDTIDHTVTTPPTPPVIKYESLHPAINRVVTFRLPDVDESPVSAVFYIPYIFDANGPEEDQLYGRWFVNYDPTTTASIRPFAVNRQEETGAEDSCPCKDCCWEAQFNVPPDAFRGEGCYQILALVSDSRFKDVSGSYHEPEREDTTAAQATWWVWVYRGEDPVSPAFDTCADLAEATP